MNPATRLRVFTLTGLAMLAFAGNSLICRMALKATTIDAASFTTVRLLSGALVLALIIGLRHGSAARAGNWPSAVALFAYAACFSYAYVDLSAATGALLLFGAVQVTMIGRGLWRGERLRVAQLAGLLLAIGGLAGLLLPGLSAPPLVGALMMLASGMAWGLYSLRGQGGGDPVQVTAGNFLRAAPIAAGLSLLTLGSAVVDGAGLAYALMSGALTSGLGYIIWYSALPALTAIQAGIVQCSVPVIAALGGILLLGEPLTRRFVLASVAVLGGVTLVIFCRGKTSAPPASGRPTDNGVAP